MDSGTEYLSDSTSYNMDVSMSLCGQEGDTSQITKGKWELICALSLQYVRVHEDIQVLPVEWNLM